MRFLRDLIVIKTVKEADRLHTLNPENLPRIRDMLKKASDIELLRYFNALKEMDQTIKNTENPSVILEYMFLKLSYFPSLVSIEELLKKGKLPVTPPPVAGPGPAVSEPQGETPPAGTEEDAAEVIGAFKKKVEASKPRMASALDASVLTYRDDRLRIEVAASLENAWKMMREQKPFLREVLAEITGRAVDVEVELRPDEGRSGAEEKEKIRQLREDKTINSLRELIKGKVISIETISGGPDE